jgi:tRNA pseudouridine38-40 synthase
METRTLQIVLQYDGARFAGWQRQLSERTVQGVVEDAVERLSGAHVTVNGAGRTDAGVHALGQSASLRVPEKWTAEKIKRALNAVLPHDVRVARAFHMQPEFHARYSALSRSYRYLVGTDEDAENPFRRGRELAWARPLDRGLLDFMATLLHGDRSFRGFAVKGTAPAEDNHHCIVREAQWVDRVGGVAFVITANRFLHHMVRFLVGTMLDVASGRRDVDVIHRLLTSNDNGEVSAPARPHGLYLESVEYPHELYMADA